MTRLSFQQTDVPAVFTGPATSGLLPNGGGTINRLCIGAPGTALNLVTLDAAARNVYAVSFDIPVPNYTLWNGGVWTVRLNVAKPNDCVLWSSVHLFRLNSAGVVQQLLGAVEDAKTKTTAGLVPVYLTPGGVKCVTVQGDGAPHRSHGDRVLVVLGFTHWETAGRHAVPQRFGFTADQTIDSPLVE